MAYVGRYLSRTIILLKCLWRFIFERQSKKSYHGAQAKHNEDAGNEQASNQNNKNKQQTKRNKFFENITKFTTFALPLKSWGKTQNIFSSILFASLTINILSLLFPLTLLQIYDRIIPNQSVATLWWLTTGVTLSVIMIVILKLLRAYAGAWADAKFEHIIGCEAFSRIMECKLDRYEQEGTGRHLKRLNALNTMRDFYAGQAIVMLMDIPFVFVFMALIAYIAGWLLLIPLLMVTLLMIAAVWGSAKMRNLVQSRQDHDNRRLNFIVEMLSKIHTIKSNTMEAQMMRRFERLQRTSSTYDYSVSKRSSLMMSESMTLSQATLVVVVAFGAMMIFNGKLTVGGLAACTLLAGRTLQPVSSVISFWSRFQSIKLAREELELVLRMQSESVKKQKIVKQLNGEITLENVRFRYSEESPLLLDDLNLKVSAKSFVSIQGEGVIGKSTLLWLMLRVFEPNQGKIFIDKHDIQTLEPYSLREHIGFLPQEAVLFQGTILDNITMFRPEFDEAAITAAEKVGLSSVVQHLPDGYDTMVGQQAVANLARGVSQRIVVARALVRNPPIILFDEANVALDMGSDEKLRHLLEELKGKHTIILISHRPSYLSLADKKYILKNKKLIAIE